MSKVVRIESGSVGVSANDLRALLDLYHVQDPVQVENLLTLARGSRAPSSQSKYGDGPSRSLLEFTELEAAASVIMNFQPLTVPGMLQTAEYAKVILQQLNRERGLTDAQIDALVEFRMKRQELLDRAEAPQMFFVLDEAVLRRPVGGRRVMRRQLARLTELAARPRITIEVLPFSVGAYPAMNGSFVIQSFPDPAVADILYQEGPEGEEISTDDLERIARYRKIFDELRDQSLGSQGSLTLLDAAGKELA